MNASRRLKPALTVLTPGPHSWSVNEYGDVRYGAASTGLPFSPDGLTLLHPATEDVKKAGIMGTLVTDSSGHAEYTPPEAPVFECGTLLDVDLFHTSPVTRIFKIRKMQLPA
ncbi:hypothetical protein R1flu_001038 [Riccia fluitans]|uniref:Uncharacterized protein n=1 Tax=Riccia fluitans TaxID=41844 RepID=A0ABD1Y244_9MARC